MPMHGFRNGWILGLGMDFGLGGEGGGGGGGRWHSLMLEMCWEAKKKSDIEQNYPVPTTRSMLWRNFLWGLRNRCITRPREVALL